MMKNKERIATAVEIIALYGHLHGKQYKAWVVDQVLRSLVGKKAYVKFIKNVNSPMYDPWDVGKAP